MHIYICIYIYIHTGLSFSTHAYISYIHQYPRFTPTWCMPLWIYLFGAKASAHRAPARLQTRLVPLRWKLMPMSDAKWFCLRMGYIMVYIIYIHIYIYGYMYLYSYLSNLFTSVYSFNMTILNREYEDSTVYWEAPDFQTKQYVWLQYSFRGRTEVLAWKLSQDAVHHSMPVISSNHNVDEWFQPIQSI